MLYDKYKTISIKPFEEVLKLTSSNINGLTSNEAKDRLKTNGLNKPIKEDSRGVIHFLINSFKDFFILILIGLAIVNFILGDKLGSIIIVSISIISALIRFIEDYREHLFNKKLKSKIYSTALVLRNKKEKIIKQEEVVIGDIVKLNAGSIVPADIYILDAKDAFLDYSAFTGESIPVEKKKKSSISSNIIDIENICLMNSSVISGSILGVVIGTGLDTYIGNIGSTLNKSNISNFDKSMKNISKLLLYVMIVTCIFVFIIHGIIKHNINEAILFALSVAVGITPAMLPMIVNVNLASGSKTLAKKKTLVKRIEAIENLGAIDILCSDKTGTLTEAQISLQKYININLEEGLDILKYAYLNSYYSTGIKNIVDKAIVSYAKENKYTYLNEGYRKVDEIPFDYARKLSSVVVEEGGSYQIITKGAIEEIIKSSTDVLDDGRVKKINETIKKNILEKASSLAEEGMQVLGISIKKTYRGINNFSTKDENNMILVGFVAFLDPPKEEVKQVLEKLSQKGIDVKILTGDALSSTRKICQLVGLENTNSLTGEEVAKMSDKELLDVIDDIKIFARLNPIQKNRIVNLYKEKGHVVGYMGDGVNDALSLKSADVGISVNDATDIAKEASDIIILERSLEVIYDGVMEGRRVYGNIIKFIKMSLASDFGDVFSIVIASIFLPFLPLLPIQMLIQDFIYEFSQMGIPNDNVDEEFMEIPRKWKISGIFRYMWIMGITSSIIDVFSFIIFYFILGYNNEHLAPYFQTAWFITCLITSLLVIFFVRTSKTPFIESMPSKGLIFLSLVSAVLAILTPILLSNIETFGFKLMNYKFYISLLILVVSYITLVTIVKKIYMSKFGEWL